MAYAYPYTLDRPRSNRSPPAPNHSGLRTTYITFELDGADAKAFFPSPLSDSGEAATLTVGKKTVPLTELGAEDGALDFAFECFD